jgi:hypothetical protein
VFWINFWIYARPVDAANIMEGTEKYRRKWRAYVGKMGGNILTKRETQCRPLGISNIGRPERRYSDKQ